jgi:hypothetical protein
LKEKGAVFEKLMDAKEMESYCDQKIVPYCKVNYVMENEEGEAVSNNKRKANKMEWCQFIVHYNKAGEFVEFLKDNKLEEVESSDCQLKKHHHHIVVIPDDMDLKKEKLCQKPMDSYETKSYCDNKDLFYYSKNFVME